MIIETIALSKINPAPYNPRKDLKPADPEYQKLSKSIKEFDIVEPLVWNKRSGNLVGGHQRLKILRDRGDKSVEVSVVDLSDAKEKALNLALNKISGEWDLPLLKDLLIEIDTGDFDIEITGFDDKEIEKIMTQLHVPGEGLTDPDDIPDASTPICKTGDLWRMGEHRLMCGDSTNKADVDKLMGGEKADMVFTDPPYGIMYLPENKRLASLGHLKSDTKDTTKFKAFVKSSVESIVSVLKDGGVYYIFMSWEFIGDIVNHLREAGSDGHNMLIWDRVKVHFRSYPQDYIPNCEFFLYGWKKGEAHIKNFKTGLEHTTIWRFETEAAKEMVHTTQKPVVLPANAIEKSSNVGNIVVDLFGGSGSTMMAAQTLGRKCYSMEMAPHYCDVIITRWENFTGKKAELIK